MKTFKLVARPHENAVEIFCGAGVFAERLPRLVKDYGKKFVFTDSNVFALYGDQIKALLGDVPVFVMEAGEKHKTEHTLFALLRAMAAAGLHRTDCLIAVGGGVVGDVGGLAAALYMRGIDCFQVPTTLLAQVDSSVGGKTAIDLDGVKNLVGVFSQAKAVIADPAFLDTLAPRELRCGLGEIVKHGALSAALFDRLLSAKNELRSLETLKSLVSDNIEFKASVVAQDEKESGIRKSLNLGHTTAHALELELKTLSHGECVLIGTIFEAELAKLHAECDGEYLDELIALCRYALVDLPQLPPFGRAARSALLDKKNTQEGNVVVTAPVKKGQYQLISLPFETYADEVEQIRRKLC